MTNSWHDFLLIWVHKSIEKFRATLKPSEGQRDCSWLMVLPNGWIFGQKNISCQRRRFWMVFWDIHPAIVQISPGWWNILNAAALGFALGNMKNRRVAEIEEYMPHEKMYQKDFPKGNSSPFHVLFYKILYVFFLKNVQIAYQYFGCLGCYPRKRRPGFDQKKMTQHSLAENCCSWIWEANGFPRYPAMGCREDSSLISKLPSGYLILKRLPLWQKGYQLGFFRSTFAT